MESLVSLVIVGFAGVFLLVGLYRVVEFSGLGLSPFQKKVFTLFHVLGCVLFSAAITLAQLDSQQVYKKWVISAFISAIVLLFPMHIFVALKRRIKLRLDHEHGAHNYLK